MFTCRFGCAGDDIQSAIGKQFRQLGCGQRFFHRVVDLRDHRARCFRGCCQHKPGHEFITGQTLGHGGNFGQRGRALQAGDAYRAQFLRAHEGGRFRDVGEGGADFTTHGGDQARPAAFEMHGDQTGFAQKIKQLARDVRIGADAGRRVVDLAGTRFGQRQQILDAVHRHRRMHGDHRR